MYITFLNKIFCYGFEFKKKSTFVCKVGSRQDVDPI